MQTVNIHAAKTQLSQLLLKVEGGKTIRICRYGKPVADLIPIQDTKKKNNRFKKHPILSKIIIHGDITKPLPPEDWGNLI
ncbi:MAG: type II toxin-antitoxin system prevent-host-death family antitoxin [Candidatus Gracilibacteria bacterium]|nr:type II toxin-antitoxin system prevent-host-death family antitoxin [bacterium]MDZ4217396.1 type II toxin-antitoxin system prevent-host-death family antitoxin [Candidatus Gracilibacteria bacterium]